MSYDGEQEIVLRILAEDEDTEEALEELRENAHGKRRRAGTRLAYTFGAGRTSPVSILQLDELLTLPWEILVEDDYEQSRVISAADSEAAREALGSLVRRPRALTRRLGEIFERNEREADIRDVLAKRSDEVDTADADTPGQRLAQILLELYRAMKKAAAREQSLLMVWTERPY